MRTALLKLSGEALGGAAGAGLSGDVLARISGEIAAALRPDLWLGIVIGAGNFVRGASLTSLGIPRQRGDTMGQVATLLNGLALQSALEARDVPVTVLSALQVPQVAPLYSEEALRRARGTVVIFVGGTGNPFFTTDTAAALRAAQMGAQVLLKATKVDGVYAADPVHQPGAEFFPQLVYEEILRRRLQVMDLAAITRCMEHRIPIRVFNLQTPGVLGAALRGEAVGTFVTE